MASRVAIPRAVRQIASSTPLRPSFHFRLSCQSWQISPVGQSRLFTVSAAAKVKQYTEDHEWIEVAADGKTATLGISEYAAKALGDVVYIELPELGLKVGAGEALGAVESVKSASDILTPVGGIVKEVNNALEEKPATINKDPEGEGWIAKIEMDGKPEGEMMNAEKYKAFTED